MHEVVQVLGSVAAVLLAFGAGWLFRELQLRRIRRRMRHKRKVNAKRKLQGRPKVGVTGTRKVRPVAAGFDAEHPWAAPKPVQRMGLTADEWLEDTYTEPDETLEPEYNEAPADELEMWRGPAKAEPAKQVKQGGTIYLPTVTRNPYADKKAAQRGIMQELLADDEAQDR